MVLEEEEMVEDLQQENNRRFSGTKYESGRNSSSE
jgi:hypothetical protein